MASATLNLRVISPRMLTPRQAGDYCGWGPVQMTVMIDASQLLRPLIKELDHSESDYD